MGIVYFNDIEAQNAYIAKISNEIRENINDRKKISKKHDFYRTIAKKSWYMPLATAIASLTIFGVSISVAGPAMLTYPMLYVEMAIVTAASAFAGKICNSRYKEIGDALNGIESEIEYLQELRENQIQKLSKMVNKSTELNANTQSEIKESPNKGCKDTEEQIENLYDVEELNKNKENNKVKVLRFKPNK